MRVEIAKFFCSVTTMLSLHFQTQCFLLSSKWNWIEILLSTKRMKSKKSRIEISHTKKEKYVSESTISIMLLENIFIQRNFFLWSSRIFIIYCFRTFFISEQKKSFYTSQSCHSYFQTSRLKPNQWLTTIKQKWNRKFHWRLWVRFVFI